MFKKNSLITFVPVHFFAFFKNIFHGPSIDSIDLRTQCVISHNFIFRGLVPRVIGEAITIALINLLSDLINQYLVEEKVCSECLLCVWFCPAETFQLSIFSPCHLVIAVHSLPFLNSHSGFTHSLCNHPTIITFFPF